MYMNVQRNLGEESKIKTINNPKRHPLPLYSRPPYVSPPKCGVSAPVIDRQDEFPDPIREELPRWQEITWEWA